ncbi:MAG: ABC transporter permease [Clostridia bacterium]|nr:ABC transporter permease [Clostridia bacterium]
MEFIKTLWKNKGLAWRLGRNDFRNRFASTSLGTIWGFLQQFIFMITYVIVFQYILKTGSAGEYPYVVWFLPGMSMWLTINDMIMSASNSIRNYSYLVKKVVFPVDIIPIISIIASSFISMFLFAISIGICIFMGYIPNVLLLLYMLFALYCFVIAFTRFTSAVSTLVPDFSQLLGIIMQLMFWFTPIVWNMNMLQNHPKIQMIFKCSPFNYLVTGFRQVFIDETIINENNFIFTIIFWVITFIIFIWGNYIFKKSKKDFADVL